MGRERETWEGRARHGSLVVHVVVVASMISLVSWSCGLVHACPLSPQAGTSIYLLPRVVFRVWINIFVMALLAPALVLIWYVYSPLFSSPLYFSLYISHFSPLLSSPLFFPALSNLLPSSLPPLISAPHIFLFNLPVDK